MDAVTEEPIGELTWTNNVGILGAAELQALRVALGSDWPVFDSLRDADEWALWRCLDKAGQRWTRVGDAKVVKAAMADIDDIRQGEDRVTRMNWWVEGIPHSAFPELIHGWLGPVDEDAAAT